MDFFELFFDCTVILSYIYFITGFIIGLKVDPIDI